MYSLAVSNQDRYIDLDEFILTRLAADDEHGLTMLYNAYYRFMLGIIRYHVRDPDAADDILQDLLINIWTKRHTLNLPGNLGRYLAAAALNSARNYLRKRRRLPENRSSEQPPERLAGTGHGTPSDSPLIVEDIDRLLALAEEKMSPRVRYTYNLVRNEGMKYREVARLLGLSVKSVEKHMGIALGILREVFARHFGVIVLIGGIASGV